MPKGSCTRTPLDERLGEGWTAMHDLMALMVEVTSIGVANRALKKPIEVPRPNTKKKRLTGQSTASERDAAFKSGIGVLAASTKAVRK